MSGHSLYVKFVLLVLVVGSARDGARRGSVGPELGPYPGGRGRRLPPAVPSPRAAVELCLYAALLAAAGIVVWRRPVAALYLFVVGLAVHNAVMAALYAAGVAAASLTAITAWKEILLAVALAAGGSRRGRRPAPAVRVERCGLARARLCEPHPSLRAHPAVDPRWRRGVKGRRACASARPRPGRRVLSRPLARPDARPTCAASGGSCSVSRPSSRASASSTSMRCRCDWWRTNGVIDYFHRHLGYDYHGTGVRTEPGRLRVRAAGELHLQRRRRQAVPAAARVDIPLAACERLSLRRRTARRGSRAAPA